MQNKYINSTGREVSAVSTGFKFPNSWCTSSRLSLHFFWDLPCFPSFFLSLTNKQNKKRKIYTSKGEHGWKNFGGIMKVIKSYEGDQFSKISFKGRGQPYFTVLSPKSPDPPPSPFPQAINNDWSLTETFPRSMINKLLPQAARPHFLWVYQRNNLSDILGEHYLQAFLMSCSPNIPNGFFRRLTNRKWSLFLVYT